MIYEEGNSWNGNAKTYDGTINVTPNLLYNVKVEVLRNDLGDAHEKLSQISFDGINFGECNPPGDDYACDFFDCKSGLQKTEISSTTGNINVALTYVGHSHDCNCNKKTWDCSAEKGRKGHNPGHKSPMIAAARVTLTPKEGARVKISVKIIIKT